MRVTVQLTALKVPPRMFPNPVLRAKSLAAFTVVVPPRVSLLSDVVSDFNVIGSSLVRVISEVMERSVEVLVIISAPVVFRLFPRTRSVPLRSSVVPVPVVRVPVRVREVLTSNVTDSDRSRVPVTVRSLSVLNLPDPDTEKVCPEGTVNALLNASIIPESI